MILQDLPEEAQQAYHAGKTYEYQPETIEEGDWRPYPCDQHWLVKGYRVENHQLFDTVWEVDSDGNWDMIDEANVADPQYQAFENEYGYERTQECVKAYLEWVAKHGDDPLHELRVDYTEPKDFYVEIEFDKGFWFKRANFLRKVEKLPQELRDYLQLNDQGQLNLDWQSMDEFEKEAQADIRERQGNWIKIKVKVDLPRSQAAIAEDLKRLARKALK